MIMPQPVRQVVSDEETRCLWQNRKDMDGFLLELRSLGARQIESIKAVRKLSGVDLGEAKDIVHYSHAWADMREISEATHRAAYEALEQLQREEAALERMAS